MQALILADGAFPTNEKRLRLLREAEHVICCDGSVKKLVDFGREPEAIVGDMDSITPELRQRFSDRIYPSPDQETNDLTKVVEHCIRNGYDELAILGATGLREDHTLANISLLADYATRLKSVCLLTDYGRIDSFKWGLSPDDYVERGLDMKAPELGSTRDGKYTVARFESVRGQQVSIFSLHPETRISALGLRYPVEDRCFSSWWQGSLNEATGEQFSLSIDKGCLLVFRL
ncbi:MAG: thiamine diphosphokinase, partial [Bacteroidota bacterium]|nr:thiamine diphosphokinase [Bacteroidota bacterium]